MALTVPVLSKFPATARITCVSSGINLAYGQVDGRLVIGEDEISLSQINCMYEFPYGDLLVKLQNPSKYSGMERKYHHQHMKQESNQYRVKVTTLFVSMA